MERKEKQADTTLRDILALIPEYACVIVLILALLIGRLVSPVFFSVTNLQNILKQGAVLAVLAIGMGYVLISGCIDLSVGINMAICALIAMILQKKIGDAAAICLAVLAGAGIACVNMLVIYLTKARAIEIMMITFGLKMAYRGMAQAATGNNTFREKASDFFLSLGKGKSFGFIPNIALILLAVSVILGFVLARTRFGRQVVSVGNNPEASRLSGINITKTRFKCFVICGICAGIAGVLLASRTMAVQALSGDDYEMMAMSGLVIGGFAVFGGYGSVWRAVLGVYVYTIINNILNLMGASSYVQKLSQGVILVLAVWMDVFLRVRRAEGRSK